MGEHWENDLESFVASKVNHGNFPKSATSLAGTRGPGLATPPTLLPQLVHFFFSFSFPFSFLLADRFSHRCTGSLSLAKASGGPLFIRIRVCGTALLICLLPGFVFFFFFLFSFCSLLTTSFPSQVYWDPLSLGGPPFS